MSANNLNIMRRLMIWCRSCDRNPANCPIPQEKLVMSDTYPCLRNWGTVNEYIRSEASWEGHPDGMIRQVATSDGVDDLPDILYLDDEVWGLR